MSSTRAEARLGMLCDHTHTHTLRAISAGARLGSSQMFLLAMLLLATPSLLHPL